MRPYVLDFIAPEDVMIFRKICVALEQFAGVDLGQDESGNEIILSCHILGRATAKAFGLRYVDGYFYPRFQHTWLLTANNNIIDIYPVGIFGGPLLVHNQTSLSPGRSLYTPTSAKKLSCGRFGANSFRRSVRKVGGIILNYT